MIDAVVELSNIEIHEHCMLNRITGEREYNNGKKQMPYIRTPKIKTEYWFFKNVGRIVFIVLGAVETMRFSLW